MQRRPDDDTPVVSEFASTEPADALTDEVGGSAPHRWATRWPRLHGRTIVIVPVTASASAGATRVSIVWRAPCTGPQPPIALRVSSRRVGGTGTNDSPDEVAVAGWNVPVRSTITSAGTLVSTQIVPAAEVGTYAAPATGSPARKFTFDTPVATPQGAARSQPDAAAPVTVRFTATAVAAAGASTTRRRDLAVSRVSRSRRAEASGVEPSPSEPATNAPCRSTTTSVAVRVRMQTSPPVPTGTTVIAARAPVAS